MMISLDTLYKERQLLRKLIKQSHKHSNGVIPTSELPVEEDNYYFRRLLKHELICVEETKEVAPLQFEYVSYAITDKGKHFFEKRHEVTKELMLKSFWLPIAVAFITSLLTNGVLYTIRLLLK